MWFTLAVQFLAQTAPLRPPQPDPAPTGNNWIAYVLAIMLIMAMILASTMDTRRERRY